MYYSSALTSVLREVSLQWCPVLSEEWGGLEVKACLAEVIFSGLNKIGSKGIFALLFILIAFHQPIGNEFLMKPFLDFFFLRRIGQYAIMLIKAISKGKIDEDMNHNAKEQ